MLSPVAVGMDHMSTVGLRRLGAADDGRHVALVEMDQISTVGLRLSSSSGSGIWTKGWPVGMDQISTVGLRLLGSQLLGKACNSFVGMDQISTVGLRHHHQVLSRGVRRRRQVGMDQISTVGLRPRLLSGDPPVNRAPDRRNGPDQYGWDCDLALLAAARARARARASEWTRSVRWDCDWVFRFDRNWLGLRRNGPDQCGGIATGRSGTRG